MIRNKTIRGQITKWFSIFFLTLLAILIALIFVVSEVALHTNTKDRLMELVNNDCLEVQYMSDSEEFDEDEGDHYVQFNEGYLEVDDDFISQDDGVNVALYHDGELIYGKEIVDKISSDIELVNNNLSRVSYQKEDYYIYDAKVSEDEVEGVWVRGVVNVHADITTLQKIIRLTLILVPFLAIFAVVGGYYISKRLLAPLDDISRQAEEIRDGEDLTARIEPKQESEEISRLCDNFNKMFERLHESFDAEKQFASDASHELRTPVAVIAAECDYALDENDSNEWREALEVIRRQNNRMANTIEELLMFTRLEQKTIALNFEKLSIRDLVEETIKEEAEISNKNINVHKDFAKDEYVYGDKNLLMRMVHNLVQNAYKYGRENGNVYVRVWCETKNVVLSISDDGIGIAEDELPLIWNRFYRGDAAREHNNSTGLGLAMVKEIAQIHHAEVKVSSKLGEGSEFRIYFNKIKR